MVRFGGKPVISDWVSGALVFYESAAAESATTDLFTIGITAVKVGGTSNDVDFQIYGTGSVSAIFDIGAKTFTLTGFNLVGANTALNATTGREMYLSGTVTAPNFGDGYGAFEQELNIAGTVAGTVAAASTWINFVAAAVPGANMICVHNDGIYLPSGITASSAKMIMGARYQYVADDGADPGSLFIWSTNIYSNALTALLDVNAKVDLGWITGAATTTTTSHIPFFKEASTGTVYYVNLYTGG